MLGQITSPFSTVQAVTACREYVWTGTLTWCTSRCVWPTRRSSVYTQSTAQFQSYWILNTEGTGQVIWIGIMLSVLSCSVYHSTACLSYKIENSSKIGTTEIGHQTSMLYTMSCKKYNSYYIVLNFFFKFNPLWFAPFPVLSSSTIFNLYDPDLSSSSGVS